MADYVALLKDQGEAVEDEEPKVKRRSSRIASLDVFRGLSVFLMMLVDYAGPVLPSIGHSPWNGLHLADFVMPFFLFIAGFALALAYKNVTDRVLATHKAVLRAVKLFFLGIFLQGGYLHGTASLTFGVDIERIRWFGILQRISIGCIVAALCEIWFPCKIQREGRLFKGSYLHWCLAFALLTIYTGLLYGLYVPDWQFRLQRSTPSVLSSNDSDIIYRVKCAVRGDLGPACNSAGVIDRYVLGVDHLYRNPVYRKLKECNSSKSGQISDPSPSWCYAPFDPEGILSSLTAAVACIIGLHYGHVLVQLEDHRSRLLHWISLSIFLLSLGFLLTFLGIPLNKPLYTISYLLVTSASAGITFCVLYLLSWRLTFSLKQLKGRGRLLSCQLEQSKLCYRRCVRWMFVITNGWHVCWSGWENIL
ncbi:PREDICTED: heparan-alpha-glucosaminide N-acetyltransferase-like isoform X2 [Nelumbo nucifera]|uniref:Heparan-alpha-glucosaminide N-acetyltransferase-like isoform X2 n=1 Tax=Nelumbo nucifera TaxID=4432 RepID=A0A1U8AJC3_NELNU|nr:PREDICTED: heparan-alpha-glucosaminide N-acetyltransferase-like isoform X2 [Nelumbo nucifera]